MCNFFLLQLLQRTDVKDYWRKLSVSEAEKDATAAGETYLLNKITLKFNKVG